MYTQAKIKMLIERLQQLLLDNFKLENPKEFADCINDAVTLLKDFSDLLYAIDSSIIVAATDIQGNIIYANKKFCEVSKFTEKELIGKNHRIINSGYHDKRFFQEMWKTIGKGEIWEGEVKNKSKDGKYYWVKTTIVPIKNKNGRPIMYIALRTDITEGKIAQEKLFQALKNDFRLVANSMYNLIFKVKRTETGYVYTMNEGRLAFELGLEKTKMLHKNPREIFPGSSADFLEKKYDQAFKGETVTYTYSFKNRYLLTYLSPVYQGDEVVEIIGCVNDITELHRAQERINYMAYYDSLTGLPNRRKFNKDMKKLISECKEKNKGFAVLLLDLDRFKQINDAFGHSVGDMLIAEVGQRLKKSALSKGIIYRFAGDEFIIIFRQLEGMNSVKSLARKILSAFEDVFVLPNHYRIFATPSIGISIYPDHGEDHEDLLKNADAAMFEAKAKGRNNFQIYQPEMSKINEEYLVIAHYLRQAIDKNEFELHYQPKLNLKENKVFSMEALLRWKSDRLGNVSPGRFIPVAEDSGLIVKIDEWVLEEACSQNKKWNEQFPFPLRVAVNISPLHFRFSNLVKMVKNVLNKTGLPPHLLEIEITETSFINHSEESMSVLTKLREMGVYVAIDDFGTGYSSLNYLRKLPITSVKIDRSFIQEADKNGNSAIIKAIINLSNDLNLNVVAEGTETKEVIEFLSSLGCNEIQGYFISKPVPRNEFEQLIQKINHSSKYFLQ